MGCIEAQAAFALAGNQGRKKAIEQWWARFGFERR